MSRKQFISNFLVIFLVIIGIPAGYQGGKVELVVIKLAKESQLTILPHSK
jgi:hypothetical protein